MYAIARDEEPQLEQWVSAARDADLLLIADSGSTDDTVRRGRELGIEVHEIRVDPFRFDHARNCALELLPRGLDMCISLDLDEVLAPGWRAELDRRWRAGATKIACWMQWRWSPQHPPLRWTVERIHARDGYSWEHPVHELLAGRQPERIARSEIEIRHLRDPAAVRTEYLELLRLAVAERPNDARLAHMFANDARMRGLADQARQWFHRALELAPQPNERLHSLLMLSHLEPDHREQLLLAACAEFADRREPWCELAQQHLEQHRWRAALASSHRALAITEPADDYLTNPFSWGSWPEQIAASASQELRDTDWEAHHLRRSRSRPSNRRRHLLDRSGPDPLVLDFVLVTFNDASAADRIAKQLKRTVRVPYTLSEIDNTSRNVGWAAACNDGAAQGDGRLIAFINQDIELPDGWLEPVLDALESDPDLAIARPRCLDGLLWPRVPTGLDAWVCGACMLVRRDFFAAVGGFDADRFPHEYAETDLERTAAARGLGIRTIEESQVVHHFEHDKSDQVLAWRAQGARSDAQKWKIPIDPWGVAHEPTASSRSGQVSGAAAPRRVAAAMLVGPDESLRYLDRIMRLARRWAQKIIVYCDRPDPDTWEAVRQSASFCKRTNVESFNESEARSGLLRMCETLLEDDDLVVILDADEELRALDGGCPVTAVRQLAASGDPGPWTVRRWHLWTADGSQHRVDGLWQPDVNYRIYRHRKGLQIPARELCCAPIPAMPASQRPPILAIAHWGYARTDDVVRKHAYYMERDGGRFHDIGHLKSIIQEPTLEPVPWLS